jgi:hypothetical protein
MKWHRRCVDDTGFLTIEWLSSRSTFSHRTMLNTRQAVKTLYQSFRSFVTSEDYDPLRYEEVTNGEGFQLVIANASLDDLVSALIPLDTTAVHSVITRLRETAGARTIKGAKASYPLSYYFDQCWSELPLSEWDSWITEKWDTLNQGQRADDLFDLFGGGGLGWYGANLRELRSPIVEEWLAKAEPPPRRSYRIPVKPDNAGDNDEHGLDCSDQNSFR